jgi:hypothetical protein
MTQAGRVTRGGSFGGGLAGHRNASSSQRIPSRRGCLANADGRIHPSIDGVYISIRVCDSVRFPGFSRAHRGTFLSLLRFATRACTRSYREMAVAAGAARATVLQAAALNAAVAAAASSTGALLGL